MCREICHPKIRHSGGNAWRIEVRCLCCTPKVERKKPTVTYTEQLSLHHKLRSSRWVSGIVDRDLLP